MTMTKSDFIREFIKQHGIIESQSNTARILHEQNPEMFPSAENARTTLKNVVVEFDNYTPLPRGAHPKKDVSMNGSSYNTLSEADLREMYDIRTITVNALKSLKDEEYWREADFIRKFLSGKTGFRSILDSKIAEPYKGKASGQVFYSSPSSILKMKEEGVLI